MKQATNTQSKTQHTRAHRCIGRVFSAVYNQTQQHPPRISLDLRTMGGYFFPGAEK